MKMLAAHQIADIVLVKLVAHLVEIVILVGYFEKLESVEL